jgi:hypothetical protein
MNIFSSKGMFKSSYNLNPLLQNRIVLYFLFFLAIADLFYLANLRDFPTVSNIILAGGLTSFFSKNMIVILCVALSVGHVTKYGTGNGTGYGTGREGATTMADSTDKEGDTEPEEKPESKPSSDKKKKAKEELMKGLKEFQSVQGDLMSGIEKLQPMLTKAESFIEKYENYKNIN